MVRRFSPTPLAVVVGTALVALFPAACSAAPSPTAAPSSRSGTAPATAVGSPSTPLILQPPPTPATPTTTATAGATSDAATVLTAALRTIGATPVKPVQGFTLRNVRMDLGVGIDESGVRWREPGFPVEGVPAYSFGTGPVQVRATDGRTVEIAVAVEVVPDGIPPEAKACDAGWAAPYYRFRTNPCRRLPAVDGFQRMDRLYDNLFELYAWKPDRIVLMSVTNPTGVKPDAPVRLSLASADRLMLGQLPLAGSADLH